MESRRKYPGSIRRGDRGVYEAEKSTYELYSRGNSGRIRVVLGRDVGRFHSLEQSSGAFVFANSILPGGKTEPKKEKTARNGEKRRVPSPRRISFFTKPYHHHFSQLHTITARRHCLASPCRGFTWVNASR